MLAVYAAAGFWLVPLLLKNQLSSFGQSALARHATAGEVRFNPFTLQLQARDVRLDEANGAPLFAVGKLAAQLQWRSFAQLAWSFSEIRVTAPVATLVVAPDGRFNVAELLATLERRPHAAATESKLPRLVIDQVAVEHGKVDLQDRRAGYSDQFSAIDFTLTHFSTLPDQKQSYTFSAQSGRGGTLRWKGQASVDPLRASGEVRLENASLPELAAYLKSYTRATMAAGQLSATLPYVLSYDAGQLQARLVGASLALRDLALSREGATDSFATLTRLDVNGVDADLVHREAMVAQVRADGGKLRVRRDAKGELDLASLMATAAAPTAALLPGSVAAPTLTPRVVVNNWRVAVKQVVFDQVAVSAVDETVSPALQLEAGKLRLQMQLAAAQTGPDLQLKLSDAEFSMTGLTLASGTQAPFSLARLGFTEGSFDLAARRVSVGRLDAQGGELQLTRDRDGKFNVQSLLPRFGAAAGRAAAPAATASMSGPAWLASARSVELGKFGAQVLDQGSGIKVHVDDIAVRLEGASSDVQQAVKFSGGFKLREGGQVSAQGSVVPAGGALEADVRVGQLALAPVQPLLAQYLKLKIAGGSVSASGHLSSGAGASPAKGAGLRDVGGLDISGLVLNEDDGTPFAAWKSVGASKFSATVAPNLLEIPELRIVEASAKLIIENDRSFNAARLLVRPAGPAAGAPGSQPASGQIAFNPFPARIARVRLQDAKLDFVDLSLRPQFGAKIYELNGVISGLSSSRESRSRIELDGRVDEFGLARVRGELNPFAPANNTDVNVVFKNVDMVSASPYTMKFAGYRIAEGKISLDLQYKVRNRQLEGANQIVIDKLRLGERVDSPDALKLPLELAIAILKDSDGRIDLGVPVSGNFDDPQFSYGALIAKSIGNVLGSIVTAPFRALGRLLGVSGGEKLESIGFDPGSHRLLPPEREKIKQVAQILGKRAQLKLSVPGPYGEAADGAALRARGVRVEIARRAGATLQPGEEPGPVDLGNEAVRGALRAMAAGRFGQEQPDKQNKPGAAGEPAGADPSSFYRSLLERLDQTQPLAANELASLGAQRSAAILAALDESGVDAARMLATAPEKVDSEAGRQVLVKLGLAAQ